MCRLATARRVRQTRQPGAGKTAAPFADGGRMHPHPRRHRGVGEPLRDTYGHHRRNAKPCSLAPAASHERSVARSSLISTTYAGLIRAEYHIYELMPRRC